MNKAIKGAKKLIEQQVYENRISVFGNKFSEYQKAYFWTNENINGYLNLVNLKDKNSALSVMSSGDHTFNLITNNIFNIDTFDTNKLTEYYVLGLKRAMICKYNYEEFIATNIILTARFSPIDEITTIIRDLLPFMDEKYRKFWEYIVEYNYTLQKRSNTNLNLMYMLYIAVSPVKGIKKYNNYLSNRDNYNLLKNNIEKANVTFKWADAINLDKEFAGKKYDLILLSNILDYFNEKWGEKWPYEKLESYVNSLENITNQDGLIFLHWIYLYATSTIERNSVILKSGITAIELKEEILRVPIPGKTTAYDGMILKRFK